MAKRGLVRSEAPRKTSRHRQILPADVAVIGLFDLTLGLGPLLAEHDVVSCRSFCAEPGRSGPHPEWVRY